ncbi:hypothetical protein SOVF_093320 [Spinacia oleracea]|nr:hypothetical protein SOVF_093320 [Spinacia oleracea]
MGKKGWFSAVKKALSPQSKKSQKSKLNKRSTEETISSEAVNFSEQVTAPPPSVPSPPPLPPPAAAAEAAVAAAQAAAEVVRLTTVPRFVGKSKEEIAAIKIQTAFRGYLARRALRALRGLVRLKSLIEGQSVKRQAATTLRCMQTLARVQSQIRARRMRMSEENQALQRQLQQKHEKELEKLRMDENWDDSTQSKEQLEASIQSKQEAAMRRERALAYAFTHQQLKKNNKNSNPTFMDPNNPQWGWSWLERWMAARPWEAKSTAADKDTDHGSVKSFRTLSVAGEINRAYALRDLSIDKPSPTGQRSGRPPSRQSPSTTTTRGPSAGPGSRKPRPESPKANGWAPDDDTRSMMSIQSERYRRHSIAGSSVRDDESLASSPSVPSYMAPTKSQRAKTKLPSPLGAVENNNGGSPPDQKPPPPLPAVVGTAKKRLSFPASPGGPRRHSVPGKFESTPVKDVVHNEIAVGNGGGR